MARTVQIHCDLDIEQTPTSFHAHAVPDGIDIRPGDIVQIHDAPVSVAFGERMIGVRTATVTRAGLLARAWTHFAGLFELTELYEVGFLPKGHP